MTGWAYLASQVESLERNPAHRALLARRAAPLADTPGGTMAQRLRAAADEAGRLAGHDHPAAMLLREAASAADTDNWTQAAGKTRLALKALPPHPPAPSAGGSADYSSWLALRVRVGTLATALRRRHAQADPAAPQPQPPSVARRARLPGCGDPLCDCGPQPRRRGRGVARSVPVVLPGAVLAVADPRVLAIAAVHPLGRAAIAEQCAE